LGGDPSVFTHVSPHGLPIKNGDFPWLLYVK
jgi:hypothetical protein